jgi:hypothetical protein
MALVNARRYRSSEEGQVGQVPFEQAKDLPFL